MNTHVVNFTYLFEKKILIHIFWQDIVAYLKNIQMYSTSLKSCLTSHVLHQ